jgi:Fe2+ transport system protein B
MEQDNRSPSLQSLGVRTWRGAAIFGLQVFAILLPVSVAIKIIGDILGIGPVAEKSWAYVLLSAVAPAFGIFIAVAFHAHLQNALHDSTKD